MTSLGDSDKEEQHGQTEKVTRSLKYLSISQKIIRPSRTNIFKSLKQNSTHLSYPRHFIPTHTKSPASGTYLEPQKPCAYMQGKEVADSTGGSHSSSFKMNRSLSTRSNKGNGSGSSGRHGFSFSSLRGNMQPELSKKLYKLIKSENHLIGSYEAAGKERIAIASQLSDWGEQTGDDALSDISDKVGVLLSELGEQEDLYAHNLDDSRGVLKIIRNTEKSVQPSRNNKAKIQDEIAKLKVKEPESTKLITLEQELVRAEAENLVAEAQLTNVTRQKMKEAYAAEFAATIERAEKQIILARHGRRLLNLLDDTPVIPGDARPVYQNSNQARQVLNDAEEDLRDWAPELEDVASNADNLEHNLMPRVEQAPAVPTHTVPVTTGGNTEHSRDQSSAASVTTGTEYAPSVPGGYDTTGGVGYSNAPSEVGTAQVA